MQHLCDLSPIQSSQSTMQINKQFAVVENTHTHTHTSNEATILVARELQEWNKTRAGTEASARQGYLAQL